MNSIELSPLPTGFLPEDTHVAEIVNRVSACPSRTVLVTKDGVLIGTISQHDLSVSAARLGREFKRLLAKHVMVHSPVILDWRPKHDDLLHAMTLVRKNRAKSAVVTKEGIPIGVVSLEELTSLHAIGANRLVPVFKPAH